MSIGYNALAINHQLALDLAMGESSGAAGDYIFDRANPHHACLLHGATINWVQLASGLYVMDFTAATPDWIDCGAAATADLDFTTEDFSIGLWMSPDGVAGNMTLLCRGVANTDGWFLETWTDYLQFYTCQAAASQITVSIASLTASQWHLVGVSRSGSSVLLYVNGANVTSVAGTHINPTTANRELHIGVRDDEASIPFDGKMVRPRMWSGRALEQWEWEELFNMERHWFGV